MAMNQNRTPGILLAGEPRLRAENSIVTQQELADSSNQIHMDIARLQKALDDFRLQHSFGRAIAAPQIGVNRRMIALVLGSDRFVMFNPRITAVSDGKTFTLWDDCFSLPDIMVRVRRFDHITVEFQRLAAAQEQSQGQQALLQNCTWNVNDRATSELLQHEIDHLDGILMIDRVDNQGTASLDNIVYRDVFLANLEQFRDKVDHFPYNVGK